MNDRVLQGRLVTSSFLKLYSSDPATKVQELDIGSD